MSITVLAIGSSSVWIQTWHMPYITLTILTINVSKVIFENLKSQSRASSSRTEMSFRILCRPLLSYAVVLLIPMITWNTGIYNIHIWNTGISPLYRYSSPLNIRAKLSNTEENGVVIQWWFYKDPLIMDLQLQRLLASWIYLHIPTITVVRCC